MSRTVQAVELRPDMILLLPMGKTAKITEAKIGRRFVNLRFDGLPKSRVEIGTEHLIEERCWDCGQIIGDARAREYPELKRTEFYCDKCDALYRVEAVLPSEIADAFTHSRKGAKR